jgi:hypothetical protein
MSGLWRYAAWFGAFGALLTFVISLAANPIGTTLLRAIYAFAAFAALAAAVGFVLNQVLFPEQHAKLPEIPPEDRGTAVDLQTPDEDDALSLLMKEQWADGKAEPAQAFQPLQPQRLVSLDNPNPEDVVHAIRRMTDE